jgi:hypothetical protein
VSSTEVELYRAEVYDETSVTFTYRDSETHAAARGRRAVNATDCSFQTEVESHESADTDPSTTTSSLSAVDSSGVVGRALTQSRTSAFRENVSSSRTSIQSTCLPCARNGDNDLAV